MGNCISGDTTTLTASSMLQSVTHSSSNRALDSITKEEEDKLQLKTDDGTSDGLTLQSLDEDNERDENHQISLGKILPCSKPLDYTKKATLRPLSHRQTKAISDLNKVKLLHHEHSTLSDHPLPNESLSQKLPQSYKKESMNPLFAVDSVDFIARDKCKDTKRELACPSPEEEESVTDDIENADRLLNELIELDMMDENDTTKRPRRMERPKTRRGLCTEYHTNYKDVVREGITQQSSMGGNKNPSMVQGMPEYHSLKDAYNSPSYKTVLKEDKEVVFNKSLELYDEADLRMIDEIEKEFTM